MPTTVLSKGDIIRAQNDRLRHTFTGGRIMLTAAVSELEPRLKARLLEAVRAYNQFDDDNDPHHEHDMAFIELDGVSYFFKVDYYDLKLEFGSEDPSDPAKTCRVLTIGLGSDY